MAICHWQLYAAIQYYPQNCFPSCLIDKKSSGTQSRCQYWKTKVTLAFSWVFVIISIRNNFSSESRNLYYYMKEKEIIGMTNYNISILLIFKVLICSIICFQTKIILSWYGICHVTKAILVRCVLKNWIAFLLCGIDVHIRICWSLVPLQRMGDPRREKRNLLLF